MSISSNDLDNWKVYSLTYHVGEYPRQSNHDGGGPRSDDRDRREDDEQYLQSVVGKAQNESFEPRPNICERIPQLVDDEKHDQIPENVGFDKASADARPTNKSLKNGHVHVLTLSGMRLTPPSHPCPSAPVSSSSASRSVLALASL